MTRTRDEYVEKLKKQLDEWNAEIDRLQEQARQAQAENKEKMNKQIEEMRTRRDEAQERMKEAQKSSDAAWDDMKDGFENAWKEISNSFNRAMSKFR